jgi:hypothetical protein
MIDTPEHIKQLQLRVWLSKSPMERLLQFLQDNEVLYFFWKKNNSFLNDAVEPERQEDSKA